MLIVYNIFVYWYVEINVNVINDNNNNNIILYLFVNITWIIMSIGSGALILTN